MTHDELKAIVAAKMADPNTTAADILSTILAALQEPNRPMSEIGQPYVRVGYDAWDVWRAMLNASPLGEQGE
ncbi:hypothetical protein [Brucella pseudintermedia]|uniref:hypothetical protein n=1 Tax=Brucella pseudintermedia TaxID=370111 RepID=UPI00320874C4